MCVIRDSAVDVYCQAKDIETLEVRIKEMIKSEPAFARTKETATAAIDYLFTQPVTIITAMSKVMGKAYNTVQNILIELTRHSLVIVKAVNRRGNRYRFDSYLSLLEKDYA